MQSMQQGGSTFLETKRLILKKLDPSDLDNLIQLRGDPEVMKYIGDGSVQTPEQVQWFLNMAMNYQAKHGFGFFSVFEKEANFFIGQAGLFHLSFDDRQEDIEIAYRLLKKFWGQGYATELAEALILWGFENLKNEKLVAFAYPENIRSRHVLEKIGMVDAGMVRHRDRDILRYEISRKISFK